MRERIRNHPNPENTIPMWKIWPKYDFYFNRLYFINLTRFINNKEVHSLCIICFTDCALKILNILLFYNWKMFYILLINFRNFRNLINKINLLKTCCEYIMHWYRSMVESVWVHQKSINENLSTNTFPLCKFVSPKIQNKTRVKINETMDRGQFYKIDLVVKKS